MVVKLLHGDCREVLATLPDGSVQCIVTSPPYYKLRDYGADGQIGLEQTPDEYVVELVAVFREARRLLRDDGLFWLNLGDSYAAARGGPPGNRFGGDGYERRNRTSRGAAGIPEGAKRKDLLGIPWMVAFALRADGWYLRSDVIWHKPTVLPESVRDRPTSAHEHVFLLTKRDRYFYDADAVAEEAADARPQASRAREIAAAKGIGPEHIAAIRAAGVSDAGKAQATQSGFGGNTAEIARLAAEAKAALGGYYREFLTVGGKRNARNVWTIPTRPFEGAHFAAMPPALAERCIRAGTSERGACPGCGAPWERVVERGEPDEAWRRACGADASGGYAGTSTKGHDAAGVQDASAVKRRILAGMHARETAGWCPTCACPEHAPVPCVVLDPFAGVGTTLLVADRLGRDAVGIELNQEYVRMARDRIAADAGLFAEVAT